MGFDDVTRGKGTQDGIADDTEYEGHEEHEFLWFLGCNGLYGGVGEADIDDGKAQEKAQNGPGDPHFDQGAPVGKR